MALEFARDRKKRWVVIWGALAFAVVGFIRAAKWEVEELVLPVSLAFSLAVLLMIPLRRCESCSDLSFGSKEVNRPCRKCGAPPKAPAGTVFEAFQGRRRLALEIPIVMVLLFFGSIRLACLVLLMIHIAFGIFVPAARRNRWMNCTAVALLVLMFAPVDIEVARFHGSHYGDHGKGLRFVRLVKGMPDIGRCLELYGEFVSGGCVVFGNEPRWLLVWDAANGKGLKYFENLRHAPSETARSASSVTEKAGEAPR